MWEGEIEIIDGVNVANQLTLRWGDYVGLSMWAQCHHKGLYWRAAGQSESESERDLKMLHHWL